MGMMEQLLLCLIMKHKVKKCLAKHGGGENYFNELDALIKDDSFFLLKYIKQILKEENPEYIILSGEIGLAVKVNQDSFSGVNIVVLNGGLRKGSLIHTVIDNPGSFKGKKVIFIDDSYYSGKTLRDVKSFVERKNGTWGQPYVFYDGSRDNPDGVKSLYRYYE